MHDVSPTRMQDPTYVCRREIIFVELMTSDRKLEASREGSKCPLGPLGFNFSQHGPTTRPSVERTAEKAFMLSDRV